ncbi:MAG: pentapeptide repeat-containing protein [Saprospiraceae bacterium]|nr:pentapeptide repeat-containing protein [Saprospiraceae bacterium]
MARNTIEDREFIAVRFEEEPVPEGEYQNCTFRECDFSQADLSGYKFIECEFQACNLSMAVLQGVTFRDTHFRDCKMMGMLFEQCNPYGVTFRFLRCNLDHSSFFRLNLKRVPFVECTLREVDFSECDLTGVNFQNCDLTGAQIEGAILVETDFRTAFNYAFDLSKNKVKKTKFSLQGLPGLLKSYDLEIE